MVPTISAGERLADSVPGLGFGLGPIRRQLGGQWDPRNMEVLELGKSPLYNSIYY